MVFCLQTFPNTQDSFLNDLVIFDNHILFLITCYQFPKSNYHQKSFIYLPYKFNYNPILKLLKVHF